MTLRMLDSVTVANLPDGADAYLGYTSGNWPTWNALAARFHGKAHLLSMAIAADEDAEGCDREPGDLTVTEIADWVKRQIARGVWRPVVYASVANMEPCLVALALAGITRDGIRILTAHYTYEAHICGPATCRALPVAADGTQWTDKAAGVGGSLIDESLLTADFFTSPKPAPPTEDDVATGQITGTKQDIVRRSGSQPPQKVTFGCSMDAQIRVDCRDGKPSQQLSLGYGATQSVDWPPAVDMIVVHVVKPASDGTPISWAY
jgi:hypothetical protein